MLLPKQISEALPFLEYEVHRQLVNKLKLHGMNALFNFRFTVRTPKLKEKIVCAHATYFNAPHNR